MAVSVQAVVTTFQAEGTCYAIAESPFRVLVTPKRKNRWAVTLYHGESVLEVSILDPTDRTQRERFLKGRDLQADELDLLRHLLIYAGLHAPQDADRWLAWRVEEAERAAGERQEQARRELDERRGLLAARAWEAGQAVLTDPALLYRVGTTARRSGLAGEAKGVRLLYLTVTSRKRRQPVNVAVKGGSSAGKSFMVATCLRLFPESAYFTLSAMSAKALVFAEEDFAHRHIVIFEHVGSEDADYLIRTLQSEGCLRYMITERQQDGTFLARVIEKPGPTGFITTTTKAALHDENETRLWSLTVDESDDQTAAVVDSIADRFNSRGPEPDLGPWVAAQEWLGLAGAGEAVIRYSHWLAERVPKAPVRIRRDFGRLLALVETSAVLFQAQRERYEDGRVVATVQDYANAHTLAGDVFCESLRSVPSRTRDLLAQIEKLHDSLVSIQEKSGEGGEVTVGYPELMAATKLTKPVLSKLLQPAFRAGVLENREPRKGMPAKLVPHPELLEGVQNLPSPDELAAAFPELAGGEWVHPLTGERKNFRPYPPPNGGNTGNGAESVNGGVSEAPETPPGDGANAPVEAEASPGVADEAETVPVSETGGVSTVSGVAGDIGRKFFRSPAPTTLITESARLREALPDLLAAPAVGLDIETTGVDPREARIRLIQLATPGRVYLVDCFAVDPGLLAPLFDGQRPLISHNQKFELSFLAAAGLPVPCGAALFDTMLAAQLLGAGTADGRLDRSGLAAVCERFVGQALDKTEQRAAWAGPLSDEMLAYAATDAAVLLPLADALRDALQKAGLERTAALEMRALPAVAWLERAGAPFDAGAWRTLSDAAVEAQVRLEHELTALAGVESLFGKQAPINLQAPEQIKKLLAERGHPIKHADEATLKVLAGAEPLAEPLLQFKEACKRVSTYGLDFLKHVHPATGRIHADYLQLGAASGRMSCRRPNLQNIPRDPRYRACFRPPEGRALVKADYSQIELRIAAQLAPDRRMLEAYRKGEDLHALTAEAVLGRANGAVTPEDRQAAKALNFGLLYGMGVERFRETAANEYGVVLTAGEAERFRDKFFRTYAGLRAWHRRHPDGLAETRTLGGRRRLRVAKFTEKLNTPVQGTGADGLKDALALLWETRDRCPGAVPVLCVHHEIVVECDAAQAEHARAWLEECMVRGMGAFLTEVPVVVESKIIRDWSGTEV